MTSTHLISKLIRVTHPAYKEQDYPLLIQDINPKDYLLIKVNHPCFKNQESP